MLDNTKDELLQTIMNVLSKEEGLINLFKFLEAKISFDRAICLSADRKHNIITNFIEYTVNQNVSRNSYRKNYLMTVPELEKHFGKDFSKVHIMENIEKSPDFSKYFKDFPFTATSSLVLPIYLSEGKEHLICISLLSNKEKNFNQTHADLIMSLRQFFTNLVMPLYYENPRANLMLFPSGTSISSLEDLIANCPDLKEVLEDINDVAKYDTTALIQGDTGTGKEIVAETIHSLSSRAGKPFVRVNCGAIPENLIESELFGYEKGAFTGATQSRKGFFEQANKGTIYLDEIGELSPNAQVRILRALENREVTRIGSEKIMKLDIRIIAATNKDLWAMVQANTFREDLYYRLNVFPIVIPPLRERKKDIPVLLNYYYNYYINKLQIDTPPLLTDENFCLFSHYQWPGNVRQLRHAIERALLSKKSRLQNELDFSFLPNNSTTSRKRVEKISKEEIERIMHLTNGRIQGKGGAAELLNMHPATLRSRMQSFGIPYSKKDREKLRKV